MYYSLCLSRTDEGSIPEIRSDIRHPDITFCLKFCICDLYAFNTSKIKYLTVFCHLHIVNTLYVPRVLGKISLDILLSYTTVQSCLLSHHTHLELDLAVVLNVGPEMASVPAVVLQPGRSTHNCL